MKLPRIRFQVSTLLWITVVVCIIMAWYHDRTRLRNELFRIQSGRLMWSSSQVLGRPDTFVMGDQGTAWASSTQDAQNEWLLLDFGTAIPASELQIFETFNPGAVSRVCAVATDGVETELWAGKDPFAMQGAVAVSAIPISGMVRRVKIYIASKSITGWNEIDAVGLVDTNDEVHWATAVKASSSYTTGELSASVWAF